MNFLACRSRQVAASTALKMIAGLSPVSGGTIAWVDTNLKDGGDHAKDISFVFQEPTLTCTKVSDNVWLPLRLKGISREAAKPQINAVLDKVGLAQLAQVDPRELSGVGWHKNAGVDCQSDGH